MPTPLVIDTDPGIDDALAVLLAVGLLLYLATALPRRRAEAREDAPVG